MASDLPAAPAYVSETGRPALVTKAPPWGWLITADLMLSELSAGLFAVAALSNLIAHDIYGQVARIGFLMAFPLVMADLGCLVADLGDPLRFHHMLRVFKIRSPMSMGVWAISLFSLLALVCCGLAAAGKPAEFALVIAGGIGIAPALFVGGYKGVLFSATPQADWKDARWLSADLVTSAGLLGVAGLLLTALFLPVPGAVDGMRRAQIATLLVNLVFSTIMTAQALKHPPREIGPARVGEYLLMLAVGWIAPLVLTFAGGAAELTVAACLIIVAAALYRREVVMMPHRALRENLAALNGDGSPTERARQPG